MINSKKSLPILPILPEAKYVQNGEYQSAYFTLGEKNNEPLLLCHGLAASGLQFVEDAKFFAQKGFYVIVPDLRGLGRSITPTTRKESDFTIANLASDLIAILDKENIESTHWVGNSLGGILALFILGSNPERLSSLITFGTAYELDVPEAFIPMLKFGSETVGSEFSATVASRATSFVPKAQKIIYEMLLTVDMFVVIAMAQYVRKYDFIGNALKFEKPILLLRGSSDLAVNLALKSTLTVMKYHSNFTLVDIKDAGHVANLDQPEAVRQAILDFISANNQ